MAHRDVLRMRPAAIGQAIASCAARHVRVPYGSAYGPWPGTWSSLMFGLFVPGSLAIGSGLVNESAWVEGLGESQAVNRRTAPAFWPPGREAGKFWRFLVTGR